MRPLGLGELLDVAIKLCARNARTLLAAVLVVVVPLQVLQTTITASTNPDSLRFDPTGSAEPSSSSVDAASAAGFATSTLLGAVTSLLATAVCYRIIASAYAGSRTTARESLSFAARRALPLLWVTLLVYVLAGLGLLGLIVLGVFLWVSWAVAIPVLLVEDTRGFAALRRSRGLVKGRWWSTFVVVVVSAILVSVITGLLTAALLILPAALFSDDLGVAAVASGLAGIVGAAVTTPFQAAVAVLLFYDLRVRKEGLDLEQMLEGEAGADRGGLDDAPRWTDQERAQAPFWPPPPGWLPPRPARPDDAPG